MGGLGCIADDTIVKHHTISEPQTGLQQGPWKTPLMGIPCKEGRGTQNVPVTIDCGLSNGSKLKAKFCFWFRSIVGDKTAFAIP